MPKRRVIRRRYRGRPIIRLAPGAGKVAVATKKPRAAPAGPYKVPDQPVSRSLQYQSGEVDVHNMRQRTQGLVSEESIRSAARATSRQVFASDVVRSGAVGDELKTISTTSSVDVNLDKDGDPHIEIDGQPMIDLPATTAALRGFARSTRTMGFTEPQRSDMLRSFLLETAIRANNGENTTAAMEGAINDVTRQQLMAMRNRGGGDPSLGMLVAAAMVPAVLSQVPKVIGAGVDYGVERAKRAMNGPLPPPPKIEFKTIKKPSLVKRAYYGTGRGIKRFGSWLVSPFRDQEQTVKIVEQVVPGAGVYDNNSWLGGFKNKMMEQGLIEGPGLVVKKTVPV